MKLYHGTTTASSNRILKDGLRPGLTGRVCLTPSEEHAMKYAAVASALGRWMAVRVPGLRGKAEVLLRSHEPLVCEVEVPASRLRVDWNLFNFPTKEVAAKWGCDTGSSTGNWRCFREKLNAGEIPSPKGDKDYRTSMRVVDSVAVEGAVKVKECWEVP